MSYVGPEAQQVLGVLDVQMSLAGIDRALEQQRQFLPELLSQKVP